MAEKDPAESGRRLHVTTLLVASRRALRSARAGAAPVERGWLPRYAARRFAWHAIDHAWEIEDRRDPG